MSGSKAHNDHRNSCKGFGKKHENDTDRKRSINRTEISSPSENVDKAVDHTHSDKYQSNKGTLDELYTIQTLISRERNNRLDI
jgi:hypothetical protein